jgi:hypothetical protein
MTQKLTYNYPLLRSPIQTLQQWAVELRRRDKEQKEPRPFTEYDSSFVFTGGTATITRVEFLKWRDIPETGEVEILFDISFVGASGSVDSISFLPPEDRPFIDDNKTAFLGTAYVRTSARELAPVVKEFDSIYFSVFLPTAIGVSVSCVVRGRLLYNSKKISRS